MSNVLASGAGVRPNVADSDLSAIIGWDIVNWSRALEFWNARARIPRAAACLELGCGDNSNLTLWLAMLGHTVVCSDAGGVREGVRDTHRRYGVTDRISYEDIDARAIPYRDRFDVVVFKSMLGGIVREDPRRLTPDVIGRVRAALKPGGMLLFAENVRSTPVHHFARSHCIGRGGTWHYFSMAEIDEMLSCFRSFETTTFGFLGCFGRSEARRRFLGKLDRAGFDKLVPRRWHYVVAAIAYK